MHSTPTTTVPQLPVFFEGPMRGSLLQGLQNCPDCVCYQFWQLSHLLCGLPTQFLCEHVTFPEATPMHSIVYPVCSRQEGAGSSQISLTIKQNYLALRFHANLIGGQEGTAPIVNREETWEDISLHDCRKKGVTVWCTCVPLLNNISSCTSLLNYHCFNYCLEKMPSENVIACSSLFSNVSLFPSYA